MEPTTIIATAIVTGAAAAAGDVAAQAVKDGYAALKALVVRKFGGEADVAGAIEGVEKRPDSEGRKMTLKEELEAAGAGRDAEVLRLARELLEQCRQAGQPARQISTEGGTYIEGDVQAETFIGGRQESHTVTARGGSVAVGGSARDIHVSGRRADEDEEEEGE